MLRLTVFRCVMRCCGCFVPINSNVRFPDGEPWLASAHWRKQRRRLGTQVGLLCSRPAAGRGNPRCDSGQCSRARPRPYLLSTLPTRKRRYRCWKLGPRATALRRTRTRISTCTCTTPATSRCTSGRDRISRASPRRRAAILRASIPWKRRSAGLVFPVRSRHAGGRGTDQRGRRLIQAHAGGRDLQRASTGMSMIFRTGRRGHGCRS